MSSLGNYPSRPYRILEDNVVTLHVRQNPLFAVVTPENKEKMRRPVDPPPIIQLHVDHNHDPNSEFLVNPFLFMTAALVEAEQQEHGGHKALPGVQIIGQNVSSCHRLKDISDRDGGFFVFGDISCRHMGRYRLQFNLFDYDKSNSQVVFVSSIISEAFNVVSQKEFKGLAESTHLSRAFSDQGVRLRLRKEPRSITGAKRTYDSSPPDLAPTIGLYGGPVHEQNYGYETPLQKRARSGSDHTNYGSASSQFSGAGTSQYGVPNNGSTWPSHSSQGFQPDQSPYGVAPHLEPQTGSNPNYQRYIQPDSYSIDGAASGSNYMYNDPRPPPVMPRYQLAPSYPQSSSQPYDSRDSRDGFQPLPTLQAAAPLPGSGLVTSQHQGLPPSTPHTSTPVDHVSSGLLPVHQMQQEQDMHRQVGQYRIRNLPIHSSNPAYHSNAPAPSQNTMYGQHPQQQIKYEQSNYQTGHNIYSVAPSNGSLSDTTLPLGSGMLTRSFAPSQSTMEQPGYDNATGQGTDGYKQEQASYPTPNQTSPMG